MGLKGIKDVERNLNREITALGKRTMRGLINAAVIIRRDMDKTPPLIPIDTGNLRASYFTHTFFENKSPALTLGFSAEYALVVHENISAKFKRPGAGAKFLQASLLRNKEAVLKEIADEAEIK